jgi:hypothetical protein
MKIGIATLTYDTDGARVLSQDSATELRNNKGSRRVSRTATLDGGAAITDGGYSAADRTYIVKTRDDDGTLATWAERIVKNYTTLMLSTRNGLFYGTPSRWWVDGEFINIEILITEEIE